MALSRADLLSLVRATGCAVEVGDSVFLCDPDWPEAEKTAFNRLAPDPRPRTPAPPSALRADGWLCIRTGGSGGGLKFARHDEHTLAAAVRGFCAHFNLLQVNAVDVLPAHHVSGLMSRVRCAATGGTHIAWDWKQLEAGEYPLLSSLEGGAPSPPRTSPGARSPGDDGASPSISWVVSLVPTQLQRLLASPAAVAWLRQFAIIFLGGGPTWPDLADAAARAGLRISLSYGMTETAAMVAALRPEEFLAGDRSCGTVLPHAKIEITSDGLIAITAESLFRGYVGETSDQLSAVSGQSVSPPLSTVPLSPLPISPSPSLRHSVFLTSDLGRLDERHHLHVLGRADAVIITGGKKVNPLDVEAALRASGEFADVAVLGLPDHEWGQIVVACYPAGAKVPDLPRAVAALAPHQRPKRFIPLAPWPRNSQGKIDRAALARQVAAASSRRFSEENTV